MKVKSIKNRTRKRSIKRNRTRKKRRVKSSSYKSKKYNISRKKRRMKYKNKQHGGAFTNGEVGDNGGEDDEDKVLSENLGFQHTVGQLGRTASSLFYTKNSPEVLSPEQIDDLFTDLKGGRASSYFGRYRDHFSLGQDLSSHEASWLTMEKAAGIKSNLQRIVHVAKTERPRNEAIICIIMAAIFDKFARSMIANSQNPEIDLSYDAIKSSTDPIITKLKNQLGSLLEIFM